MQKLHIPHSPARPDWTRLVWEQSRSRYGARIVLLWLAFNADSKGCVESSISQIARDLNCGRRQIQRSLYQLYHYNEVTYNESRSMRGHADEQIFRILLRPREARKAA